jgi:hypothetical protein
MANDEVRQPLRRIVRCSGPALIGLANAGLPDSDPRKITRERLEALRDSVRIVESDYCVWKKGGGDGAGFIAEQLAFLDALATYLSREPV